ncbi:heavy metal translocating P-type ATPase [Aureimonas frigidaquae]|uniref:heavy metal translocating P-type ATPase n=1 Tax=Aureimonas frigidaquae TaxID=424757 RepID=UPI000AF24325|nr:heavy metal translocating P-type ATPase [Aureimonas frigidaquae]
MHSEAQPFVDDETCPELKFRVTGMDCGSCAAKVENAMARLPGFVEAAVSVPLQTMTLRHDGRIEPAAVMRQVRALGFCAELADRQDAERPPAKAAQAWSLRAGPALACGLALAVAYGIGRMFPQAQEIALILSLLVGLVPVAGRAFAAARTGSPFSIELLMTIAAVGAVLIGATEEAAAVVFLFLIGEMLEGVAAGRARQSIGALTGLVPDVALMEEKGVAQPIPAARVVPGMILLVRPGDRIAADGDIVDGVGAIDEAPVTGESVPRRKGPGDAVFAGTINTDGVLRMRATSRAADNTIARIVRLVEEAQESKAPTARFIDRFARIYTPFIVGIAALVAVLPPLVFGGAWDVWVYRGLALLLIGCPCALVISTPAAIAAGLATGARRGLLVKGGAVLEALCKLDYVAFDKTGTLTRGRPVITDIVPLAGHKPAAILSRAAALEAGSSHPFARAVLDAAAAEGVPVPPAVDARALAGEGVEARLGGERLFLGSLRAGAARAALSQSALGEASRLNDAGKTVSVLMAGERAIGLLALRDEPRPDAREGLANLKALGVETIMLTGDHARTAQAIGGGLGIAVKAELMPQDKLEAVRAAQRNGRHVGVVGDGINDAPALAAADIGIAMGGGTDVALETADAAVLHGRVGDVAQLIALSRAVMRNIHVNIGVALGLKAVFLVTTIAGVTGLWPAILADTGATVLVTANAMRLLRWRGG